MSVSNRLRIESAYGLPSVDVTKAFKRFDRWSLSAGDGRLPAGLGLAKSWSMPDKRIYQSQSADRVERIYSVASAKAVRQSGSQDHSAPSPAS
jgi:hypothetical protein